MKNEPRVIITLKVLNDIFKERPVPIRDEIKRLFSLELFQANDEFNLYLLTSENSEIEEFWFLLKRAYNNMSSKERESLKNSILEENKSKS